MKIANLVRFCAADLPGCPDQVIEIALLEAAIELCQESFCWSAIQGPQPIIDGQREYVVDCPDDGVVVAIRSVYAVSREIMPRSMNQIQVLIPNWQVAAGSEPAYYNAADTDPDSIRLFPIPMGANGATLTARVAYAPSLDSTTLDDTLVSRYRETISEGAKYRLMRNPGRQWSNPQEAMLREARFRNGIANARGHVAHDHTPGTITVQPRRFI